MNILNLQDEVNQACNLFDIITRNTGMYKDLSKNFRLEIALFMMYLSASDGTISWDEAKVISDISGITLTPNEIGDLIRKNNIYSVNFEQTVPTAFRDIVSYDRNALTYGGQIWGDGKLSQSVLVTYKHIGEALITSDGDVATNEMNDLVTYLTMLRNYIDNSLYGGSGASGFIKR